MPASPQQSRAADRKPRSPPLVPFLPPPAPARPVRGRALAGPVLAALAVLAAASRAQAAPGAADVPIAAPPEGEPAPGSTDAAGQSADPVAAGSDPDADRDPDLDTDLEANPDAPEPPPAPSPASPSAAEPAASEPAAAGAVPAAPSAQEPSQAAPEPSAPALAAPAKTRHVLVVRDDAGRCRRRPATARLTSAELAGDLKRYFRGRRPRLDYLAQVFTEGRIKYCTRAERHHVEAALADLGMRHRLAHEGHWRDWVYIWGTWNLRRQIEERLTRPGLSTKSRRRLESARETLRRRLDPGRGR